MDSFEQQIRERAYHLWVAAGRADGLSHEHWAAAERALTSGHDQPKAARAGAGAMAAPAGQKPAKTTPADMAPVSRRSASKQPAGGVATRATKTKAPSPKQAVAQDKASKAAKRPSMGSQIQPTH